MDSCPLPGHDTPGHPVCQRGEAGVYYSLAAFLIREARGWKFELVADCTSIDPARRDYFFPLCGCVCFYPARTDREEEHFRAGHPTTAFGSDGPTPLRYGFFRESMTRASWCSRCLRDVSRKFENGNYARIWTLARVSVY